MEYAFCACATDESDGHLSAVKAGEDLAAIGVGVGVGEDLAAMGVGVGVGVGEDLAAMGVGVGEDVEESNEDVCVMFSPTPSAPWSVGP